MSDICHADGLASSSYVRCFKLSRNFLWGTTSDKHKLHLVKWSTVTKPKKTVGLGIREARHVNIALLAKVGGQMMA